MGTVGVSETARINPLKKRVRPSRPVRGVGDKAIEELLSVELPRASDQLLALQTDVQTVTNDTMDHERVVECLEAQDLIFLIRRGEGDVGLLVVDPGLLAALIEVQTLGQVTAAVAKERLPTRTDAVVASDLLDKWLTDTGRAAEVAEIAQELPFYGYARQHGMLGLRAVELTLDPGEYQSLRVTMSLGGGAKTGALTFYLPAWAGISGRLPVTGSLGEELRSNIADAPAVMEAILARVDEPLERVLGFQEGDVISVPLERLYQISLEAGEGRKVADAQLGQIKGNRAVRLKGPLAGHQLEFKKAGPLVVDEVAESAVPEALSDDVPEPQQVIEAEQPPDMPEISDLPDLPELPELPELPDLP